MSFGETVEKIAEHEAYERQQEKERKTVRLTERAHILLAEKAKEHKTSMKIMASEAIFLLTKSEARDNIFRARIEQLEAKIKRQKEMLVFYVIMTGVGGAILGLVLGLVLGQIRA